MLSIINYVFQVMKCDHKAQVWLMCSMKLVRKFNNDDDGNDGKSNEENRE